MTCGCKEGAACYTCHPELVDSPEWGQLVRKRQLDELEGDMAHYKHKYYCEGSPEVTDAQYDRYEEVLKRERPDSWVLASVGCPLCYNEHGGSSE